MKIKSADLKGNVLDWAVAKCEGATNLRRNTHVFDNNFIYDIDLDGQIYTEYLGNYTPSSDWSLAGPIIEREKIDITSTHNKYWLGSKWDYSNEDVTFAVDFKGDTPLIAAMRTYVANKLGDEVEIPDELFI